MRVVRAGFVRRHQGGAAGRRPVEHLAGLPLRRLELEVPRRQVVEQRVPGHGVEGLVLRDVLAAAADHERDLGLVVHLLGVGGKRHLGVRRGQGVRPLGEEGGRLGRLQAGLLRVRAVVQAQADDLPGGQDRRQQLDVAHGHAVPIGDVAVQRGDPRPAQELGQIALEASENPLVAKDSGARPPSGVVRHQSHRWAKLKLTGRRIAQRANRSIEIFDTCTRWGGPWEPRVRASHWNSPARRREGDNSADGHHRPAEKPARRQVEPQRAHPRRERPDPRRQ